MAITRRIMLKLGIPSIAAVGMMQSSLSLGDVTADKIDSTTWRSVLSFGAIGDGNSDDTAAFNAAYDSKHEYIFIPSGYRFVITSPVGSLTRASSKKWIGDSASVVVIRDAGGFHVAGMRWGFSGIRFIPDGKSVGCAIKSGTINSNRNSFIHECIFNGEKSGCSFKVAIDLYNAWYSSLRGLFINNSGEDDFSKNICSGIGIRLNFCANTRITECDIGSCDIGISITSTLSPVDLGRPHCCEGITISSNTIIANKSGIDVREGYFINVNNNVIDIPLKDTENIIYFAAMCSKLSDNWISVSRGEVYIGKGESGSPNYDGSCNIIDSNIIRGNSKSNNNLLRIGDINLLKVTNNQIQFGKFGIVSIGGSQISVSNNMFAGQSSAPYDLKMTKRLIIDKNNE
ncbi:hypothetical protein HC231_16170 [Brenneria izadpanahii]|uniref:Rhamnogalacturonase A/B/Epimerase-like pectate lyase domain-containing protein n=1 Tax=Brenneria izadpanahii TaxID=2722756 RepID=A0ABX7UVD0_9GAMM|nr:glycosyl hydrolase family 28-related protein [Brenneria izadpanahii]QTF09265.1 hypothetical protein HC231_16170 [Brenneria izadpanahii]